MHSHRHQDFVYYDFKPNKTPKTYKPISKRRKPNKVTENTHPTQTCNSHLNNRQLQSDCRPQLAVSKSSEVQRGLAAMQRAVTKQQAMIQRFCLAAFTHSNHRTHQLFFNQHDPYHQKLDSPTLFFSDLHCEPDENPLFSQQTASDLQKADAPAEAELDYDVSAYFND